MTNGRERMTVTPADCRPSDLAENFLHFTFGSISGYESGYISDTGRRLTSSKISNTSTSSGVGTEADAEDIDEVWMDTCIKTKVLTDCRCAGSGEEGVMEDVKRDKLMCT